MSIVEIVVDSGVLNDKLGSYQVAEESLNYYIQDFSTKVLRNLQPQWSNQLQLSKHHYIIRRPDNPQVYAGNNPIEIDIHFSNEELRYLSENPSVITQLKALIEESLKDVVAEFYLERRIAQASYRLHIPKYDQFGYDEYQVQFEIPKPLGDPYC